MVPAVIKVYRGGVIKLPARARREAGVSEGDTLLVTVEGGRVVLTPSRLLNPLEQLASELGGLDEERVFELGVKRAKSAWKLE